MFQLILSCKQIDKMIFGKIKILEADWTREGVLSDRNILVWSCRVVVTAFQSLDSITQWSNLIWTWSLLNFKQLLADNFKGVVTWKLTMVLHTQKRKKKLHLLKNSTSKVNGHAPKKIFQLKRRRSLNQMHQVNWRVFSSRLEWIRQFYDGYIAYEIRRK